jgi:hypothetical protein
MVNTCKNKNAKGSLGVNLGRMFRDDETFEQMIRIHLITELELEGLMDSFQGRQNVWEREWSTLV